MLHDAGAGGLRIPDTQGVARVCDLHGLQLETALLHGDSRIVHHDAIRDVIADVLPRAHVEPTHLLSHVLPQLVSRRAREGLRPDIGARTVYGQPVPGRSDRQTVWFDVKTLSPRCATYLAGPAARSFTSCAVADVRAARVHREAVTQCRLLDHEHSRQAGGARYPGPRQQERDGVRGPVLRAMEEAVGAANGGRGRIHGLVVGSWQDTSAAVDALAAEAADAMAAAHWRLMGARTQAEARGVFMQHVLRRLSATFWRSWHASQRARVPCIGRDSSVILRVGAPAAAQPAWHGDYPLRGAGVARGGAAARDHA